MRARETAAQDLAGKKPAGVVPIGKRLKDLLDETRLAMLGTQLLMGLQYRAAFADAFDNLPITFRRLDGIALVLILIAAACLLATPAFHQIAESGHATARIIMRASNHLKFALLPLSLAIGINLAIAMAPAGGLFLSLGAGLAFTLAAWTVWFGIPFQSALRRHREIPRMEDKTQSLETRIKQALTELRVILPGAQALFGFQFTAVLTQSFQRLPPASQAVHMVSLALVAIAVILLIAPVAYHRIAARGHAEEGVLRYAVGMMLPALGLLSLGLVGDCYVTLRKIATSSVLAIVVSLVALLGFAALLYLVPLLARRKAARSGR